MEHSNTNKPYFTTRIDHITTENATDREKSLPNKTGNNINYTKSNALLSSMVFVIVVCILCGCFYLGIIDFKNPCKTSKTTQIQENIEMEVFTSPACDTALMQECDHTDEFVDVDLNSEPIQPQPQPQPQLTFSSNWSLLSIFKKKAKLPRCENVELVNIASLANQELEPFLSHSLPNLSLFDTDAIRDVANTLTIEAEIHSSAILTIENENFQDQF